MQPSDLLHQLLSAAEADLKTAIQPLEQRSSRAIHRMVEYHLGWDLPGSGGKRVRPLFTLLCCGAAGGTWEAALPAASAVECIHNFSLIHDDIQDQSATRRGRETLWSREGAPQAINTGDAVFALARLSTRRLSAGIAPEVILEVQAQLDQACLDLTIGQHLDLQFEEREQVKPQDYLEMIAGKTAALVIASCSIGSLIGGADQSQQAFYAEFGRNVGLAFQMYDDLLGIWGDPQETGKPAGDDIRSRKKTLPILFGFESSKDVLDLWQTELQAETEVQAMISALDACGAKSHTLEQAGVYSQKALSSLKQAQPLKPFAEELTNLTNQLLRRNF